MKLSLPWKWFGGLAALLVALLVVVNIGLDLTLPPFLVARIRDDLRREALLARAVIVQTPATEINDATHRLAQQTGLRVTVMTGDGAVIGESDKPASELAGIANHLDRPEVQEAKRAGTGSATRRSETIGVDLLYVAARLDDGGFVRVALPLHEVAGTTNRARNIVALASLIVFAAALPVVYWLSRRLTRPLEGMRAMAVRVAAGDFTQRAPEAGGPELRELGVALNQMSRQLEQRLGELASEKAELNATLAGMSEGVLVVDAAGRIRLANRTLRRQFQLTDDVIGKTPLEAFRHVGLAELIDAATARELTFLQPDERVFVVTATALPDKGGAVVVFHDITRIKQLENMRKEFVANVSHELRTPLSIIKGYVETLLEHESTDPATARQFLLTTQKHAQRLEALIGDLLTISALESQQARLTLTDVSLGQIAREVVEELRQSAREKQIDVDARIELPAVRADAQRLHQVLFNLLDNAVKYTQPGGRVTVTGVAKPGEIEICVADNGPGIASEHLPHVFERFYRADKARSRELGGTGLGLSIVKHIVQAHGGRVWAESALEKGSRFYFTLPA